MKFPDLKQFPAWLLLLALGAIAITVGTAQEIVISGNTLRLTSPLNFVLIVTGVVFVGIGIIEFRRSSLKKNPASFPIEGISIDVLDLMESSKSPRARIRGKVTPVVSGVRIWILREHLSGSPGKFHVGAQVALTDKNGEWQQFTNLWKEGRFRIHAIVVDADSELLFKYYRTAFEQAREIFKKEVDPKAVSFPNWPFLDSWPSKYVSSHSEIVV